MRTISNKIVQVLLQENKITEKNFEVMYANNYELLVKYAFVIIKQKQESQDVVSDVFVELWNKRNRLSIHTDIKNYLLVSVRRAAKKKVQTINVKHEFSDNDISETENPFSTIITKESINSLEELFKQLPGIKYEIIQLRLLGLTYQEIAGVLNVSVKKVEYHLHSSIILLREKIQENKNYTDFSVALGLLLCLHEVTIW